MNAISALVRNHRNDEAVEMIWQFSDDVGKTWFANMSPSRALSPPAWVNEDLEAK